MTTGAATIRRRTLTLALALAALAAAVPAPASSPDGNDRKERYRIAQQQLQRADQERANLEKLAEGKRSENTYLQVLRLYRRVYDIAPFSGLAADALYARALVYHDMGKLYGKAYFKKCIEAYEFLLQEYPMNEYRDRALYNIGRVQYEHLDSDSAALNTFRTFLRKYPGSEFAGSVRETIDSIEKRLAADRQEQKSRSMATPASAQTTTASAPVIKPTEERTEVQNIRYWNAKGYTRVVLDLQDSVQYQEARVTNPDRIFFDLFNTRLGSSLTGKEFDVNEGLLNRIRVAENRAGVTRVVLEVNGAKDYSVFTLPNPHRLVVDIRSAPVAEKPAAVVAKGPARSEAATEVATQSDPPALTTGCGQTYEATQARPASTGNHTLSRALGLKVNRIVLDPGHGGNDHGTTGRDGLKEKELVLDIATKLGERLEKELCAEVVFTRSDDTFVPLENRTALANQKQADLFVSIHANYSRTRGVRGVETYYLNFTSDPEALDVAARENALSQQSVHDLQDIVKKISRNEKINESRELAAKVQDHLSSRLRRYSKHIRDRGVKKAPFVVLIGANMPSVLAEISFISNAYDENHLKSSPGRDRVVEGLFNGISSYLEEINGLMVAQASD